MNYLLVGYGNIGAKRRNILGRRCIGAVDPFNPEAEFSDLSQCPKDGFDAVILSVPDKEKLKLIRHFLPLGKHVLVEKPLWFPDEETVREFEESARCSGAVLYTSYSHRFEPNILRLKELLSSGVIGEFYSARFFYGNGTVRDVAGSWREEGYGVLADLGSHLVDLSGFLLGYQGSEFIVLI